MRLHLRPLPKPERKRCDTRALIEARARVRRDLESTIIPDKHNRHIREASRFRQTGETA